MPRRKLIQIVAGLVLVLVLGIGGWYRSLFLVDPSHLGGTMGTLYSVRIPGKIRRSELARVHEGIIASLAAINAQMSTWDPESEISRFNHAVTTNPVPVSEEFASVVRRSLELSASTNGAFDPTLQPLLNLWGFGSEGEDREVPTDGQIAEVKARTGWQKISVNDTPALGKEHPSLALSLGAIAKGYGVDALAGILEAAGYESWFVEIGGEVVVKGVNPDGVPWRIGIQYPTTNPMDERTQGILHMTSGAVATSGDYRNYVEEDGRIYSHILDPRTGRAVETDTASVTVVTDSCMDADGMATALFVIGAEEGIVWVDERPGVEAMFLVRGDDGEISEKFSSGFVAATGYISGQ